MPFHAPMTPELANRLIDFFKSKGRYTAFLVGGGDWDWRRNPDPRWQEVHRRFDAYAPWNVGNYVKDKSGTAHAATDAWAWAALKAARWPARPAPTTSTSCSGNSNPILCKPSEQPEPAT